MGLGLAPSIAFAIDDVSWLPSNITATGTSQGTAATLANNQNLINLITAASNTGLILPASPNSFNGDPFIVNVASSTTGIVYPPVGGTINGGSVNAGINVAQNKTALFYRFSALVWLSILTN
jgi:hypothetical protein